MSNATQPDVPIRDAVFVSPETAAALLGLSRSAVYNLLREGEIASVKRGKRRLVSRESVQEWAEHQLAAG